MSNKQFNSVDGYTVGGNANISIVDANGNVTATALSANGNVSFTGANVSLGNVSNLKITGGSSDYLLATDGTGNLLWVSPTSQVAGAFVFTQSTPATTWVINHNLGYQYVNIQVIDSTGNSFTGRYNYPTITFNNTTHCTVTFDSAQAGYAAVTSGGGEQGPPGPIGGSNTQIIFNDSDSPNGSANLTFNKSSNTFTTYTANVNTLNATVNVVAGNVYANSGTIGAQTLKGEGGNISNIQGGNVSGAVASATSATTAGTVTTASQPNITSVGTLTGLVMGGNITPSSTNTYSLGNNTNRWDNLWLAGNTIYLGNANIQANATAVIITNPAGGQFIVGGSDTASTSKIYNGNSNVNIPSANGNVNITAVGNTTVVVTGTGANITGTANISGNANVGNLGTAQLLASANVTAPQLISNVATGTAPFVISSTTKVANLNVEQVDGFDASQSAIANTLAVRDVNANISANYFIGNGSQLTGIITSVSNVTNGTSNLNIATADGNVTISVNGNANIVTVTGTGANITGTANITGNANVGNIGATRGVFTNIAGEGGNISNIQGSNVSGAVASATAATNASAVLNNVQTTGTYYPVFISSTSNGNYALASNTTFSANIANGGFIATTFVGNIQGGTGNSNVGNIGATTGVFTTVKGEGGNLSNIQGANVSGAVAYATTANSVAGANVSGEVAYAAVANSVAGANVTGTVSSATNAVAVLTNTSTNTTVYLTGTQSSANGNVSLEKVTGIYANMGNNAITATTFVGNVQSTGNSNIGNLGTAQVLASANVTAPQFISNVATGTAPLTVASNTVVANLNADLLDGYNTATANTASTVAVRDANGNVSANFFIGNGSQLTGTAKGSTTQIQYNNNGNLAGSANLTYDDTIQTMLLYGSNANVLVKTSATATSRTQLTGSNLSVGNPTGFFVNIENAGTLSVTDNVSNTVLINSDSVTVTDGASQTILNASGTITADANITTPQFISNVATGTAPFVVSSTTQVANLNVANAGYATTSGSTTNATAVQTNTSTSSTVYLAGVTSSANGNRTLNIVSGITANFANNAIVATTFVGNLSGILANGNSNVNIPAANGNVNISAVGNANVLVVTGTGVNVSGTLNATGNANAGNIGATRGVFTNVAGEGGNLSNIQGGNVSGAVASATAATNASAILTNTSTNTTVYLAGTSTSANGNVSLEKVTGIYANMGNNSITATTFVGALSGAATTAGTVTTNAQPNITSVGTLTDLNVNGNGIIGGNLYVNGNLTYLNTETLAIEDPIINLQTGPNGAAPIANSGKDVGTALNYYDSQARIAFMGWDVSNVEFGLASQASITNEVVTFTTYGNLRVGNIIGNGQALTGLAGANVTGWVPNANVANFIVSTTQNTGTYYLALANTNATANASINSNTNINVAIATGTLSATIFSGSGNALSNIQGANVSGNVATANLSYYANTTAQTTGTYYLTLANAASGNVSLNGNTNINVALATGTLNATLFAGSGANLTNLAGANVTGWVPNANVANYVLSTAQTTGIYYVSFANASTSANVSLNANSVFSANIANGALIATTFAGNIQGGTGNSNVGNIGATRGVFTNVAGEGGNLSNIQGGNVSGAVASATSATNASALLQNTSTATTVYPTFTASSANGNSSAVINTSISANLGNASITATTFVGTLSGAATTAGTVTTNAQPNITSVSTSFTNLTFANAQTISGNNITITTGSTSANGTLTGNWVLSSSSKFQASDGNSSNVLYGNGVFAAPTTGVLASISNGNSNVNIPAANGNVTVSVAGNANVATFTGTGLVVGTGTGGNISGVNVVTANTFIGTLANGNSNVNIPAANGNVNITAVGNTTFVVTGTGANITGYLNVTGNANVGNIGGGTAVFSTGNLTTINSGLLQNGTSNITITSGANVSTFIGGNATAQFVVTSTGANIAGTANVVGNANVGNLGTSSISIVSGAATKLSVTANAAPTADMISITNAGQAITTAGVNGISLTYVGGAAAVEASAHRTDLTPGGTTGGTWNGFRMVASSNAASGVTMNAIKVDPLPAAGGAGTENAIYVGANWDNIVNYNGTAVIYGNGIVNPAQVGANVASANVSNVANFTVQTAQTTGTYYLGLTNAATSTNVSLNANTNINVAIATGTLNSTAFTATGNVQGANIVATQNHFYSVATGISAAGTVQGNATAITKDFNVVSTVASGAGVVLPAAIAGYRITVLNTSANALLVYPNTSDAINGAAVNTAYSQPASARLDYICVDTVNWYTLNATYG